MRRSRRKRPFIGRVQRAEFPSEKAFTNFAHLIEELGFSIEHTRDHVDFNLQRLFQIPRLNELVAELLTIKLRSAGWDQRNTLLEEVARLRLHEVFSVKKETLIEWLERGGSAGIVVEAETEDADFFFAGNDGPSAGQFVFKAGHNVKKTGSVAIIPSKKATTADLLHNEIQNSLVARLQEEYGEQNVRSEQPTGQRTAIDIVVQRGGKLRASLHTPGNSTIA